jgi:transcriptional regulator with XRE-family HTH domain
MDSTIYTDKIKAVRKLKRLTQQDMADRLGYNDVKEYGRVETGEKRLTLELLEAIAQVFEMTVIGLLSFDEKAAINHCTGAMSVYGDNTYHEGNAALVAELKAQNEHLKGEVAFLREELKAARARG